MLMADLWYAAPGHSWHWVTLCVCACVRQCNTLHIQTSLYCRHRDCYVQFQSFTATVAAMPSLHLNCSIAAGECAEVCTVLCCAVWFHDRHLAMLF